MDPNSSDVRQPLEPVELPRNPRYGDHLIIDIDELNAKGVACSKRAALVGPQKAPKTYHVQARKALPGERVEVHVETYRKKIVSSHIVRWLETSPDRIEPRCGHFGLREVPGKGCGGCTLQNMKYARQLDWKRATVQDLLQAQGLDPALVRETIACATQEGEDAPWYYRNKMEFSFGDDRERRLALGMHPVGFHREVIRMEECYLLSLDAVKIARCVRDWCEEAGLKPYKAKRDEGFLRALTIREGKRTGERMVEWVTTHAETVSIQGQETPSHEAAQALAVHVRAFCEAHNIALTSWYWTKHRAVRGETTRMIETLLFGPATLRETLHLPGETVLSFNIHPRAFFQPNTLQAERLYTEVVRASGLMAPESEERPSHVLDLYCGTGTIGLCVAPFAERVIGIELQPDAVENARINAQHNAITNVEFHCGDVGDVLAQLALPEAHTVIVDPPRSGLHTKSRRQLFKLNPSRIVYVSCNPSTLARDLADFVKDGVYRLESVQPVDMFPHTPHIENVCVLQRVS